MPSSTAKVAQSEADVLVLQSLVQSLHKPANLATQIITSNNKAASSDTTPSQRNSDVQHELQKTAQTLFRRVQQLAKLHAKAIDKKKKKRHSQNEAADLSLLYDLNELYTGDSNANESIKLNAETIWELIDVQNQGLAALAKSSMKTLVKAASNEAKSNNIRLLEDVADSSDSEDDSVDDKEEINKKAEQKSKKDSLPTKVTKDLREITSDKYDDDEEDDDINDYDDEADDDEEVDDNDNTNNSKDDEETRRIKARMQRALEDMESDDDDDDDDDDEQMEDLKPSAVDKEDEESLPDPAAEKLNDGFFNINEMEDFADEEEEFLPDEAYADEKPDVVKEKTDKRSFHQKQREGDMDDLDSNDDDDDDDDIDVDETDLLFKAPALSNKRKKYRADNEVEALYRLYTAPKSDDDDEDSAAEAANMTAADFYGEPNKKYFDKWNNKFKGKDIKDETDSWDDFDFGHDGIGSKKGWNEEMDDDDDASVTGGGISGDNDDGGDDDDDVSPANEENDGNDDEKEVTNKAIAEKPSKKQKTKQNELTRQQEKLKEQIKQLEKEMLAEKPWQMKGEIDSGARPANSLLTGTPEFERASKMAPTITVEHTANLEEAIKQRILNEDWDDVIPRELPDVGWNKKRGEAPEVSQEKSKLGLGELYEREYLKKVAGYDVETAEKVSLEDKAKAEMKSLFAKLCSSLDALSNYHFAPRPIADEAEIRTITTPAIAMEEVLPLHVSDARTSAPEEVYERKRGRDGVLRNESEMDQSDRQRLRRAKKANRRQKRKEKEADEKLISRLQPGLGLNNPYEKRKMRQELSEARAKGKITAGETDANDYSKSNTFFQRLQKQAQGDIKDMQNDASSGSNKSKKKAQSSSFKL